MGDVVAELVDQAMLVERLELAMEKMTVEVAKLTANLAETRRLVEVETQRLSYLQTDVAGRAMHLSGNRSVRKMAERAVGVSSWLVRFVDQRNGVTIREVVEARPQRFNSHSVRVAISQQIKYETIKLDGGKLVSGPMRKSIKKFVPK